MTPEENNSSQELKRLENIFLSAKKATKTSFDWENAAKKSGTVVAFLTIIGAIISSCIYLYALRKDLHQFTSYYTEKMIEITNRQSFLEGKMEALSTQLTEKNTEKKDITTNISIPQSSQSLNGQKGEY